MADTFKISNKFFDDGWGIFKSENLSDLNKLREEIHKFTKDKFDIKNTNIKESFDNFHNLTSDLNDAQLNEKKVNLIKDISANKALVDLIYKSFENIITSFVGNDVLVQKTINIVIQPPNDNNPTIPHRDAPPNSFYEIVLWIPLTDCSNTKSMYVINRKDSEEALNVFAKNSSWENFLNILNNKKKYPSVKFGEALFFMPNIYHGSDTNITNETRFSLNIRFKNLFTPSGKKFPLHFFRPYKISKFIKFAIENQRKEELNNFKDE